MSQKMIPFREVLRCAENLAWSDSLYLPEKTIWSSDSLAAVLPDDPDSINPDDVPAFASKNGLRYALQVSDIQSIVRNALKQRHACADEELFQAFLYYFNNDAYIEFGNL